ncbi:helix-turn-helix domain-containing protein [Aquimarina aquimarini]|uniref:helix-turn-helix domain-containing protein n=1 Tax=Aquimarina aquimarini TaxID=1191734 RepID=UPI000D556887|nr:AraC family transcriptional regulator [Aquimarina aquimarini]
MNTIILPDELNLDSSTSVNVYDYKSSKEISKQQITLNKNTFSFLREGTKEIVFDTSSLSINHTEFLLMKSGHCLMTEKLCGIKKHYKSVLLFFSNDAVYKLIRKLDLNTNKSNDNKSIFAFEFDQFIERFVDSLYDISKLSRTTQKKILEVKLEEILLYLIETKGIDFLFSLVANNDDTTQKFIRTIENNQLNKLTLKELAFLCDMSISSFKRTFEKHYKESPIKWFQDKRLEYAFYLLREEKKRSSDIYLDIGYENLSSFVQAYKSKYGVTPKQHQKD